MGADRAPSRVALHELRVTDDGLSFRLPAAPDVPVDVTFDGRRVWSFWTVRDTEEVDRRRLARWPTALEPFLNGRSRIGVLDHVSGSPLGEVEALLGDGRDDRVAVVDRAGRPLALDKSLALTRIFSSRDRAQVAPLLDAIDTVVAVLREIGIEPFLAYGSLLGATRSGRLIGHDSDVDLGYVSRRTEPVDVILESFRLQRELVERGYSVVRYSGLALRVNVREADGALRGLDVFGGFLRAGTLYLMGEVGAPFEESWIRPLGTTTLEGRTYPAPARPDKLLEATYGPGWRVPDPAFRFETPEAVVRRLTGWFRGTRGGRNLTWPQPSPAALRKGPVSPSEAARAALAAMPEAALFVDAGCGPGLDAFWAAQQGVPARGLDFRPSHYRHLESRAARERVPVTYGWANFNEVRSSLASGAELARLGGPRLVLARHLVDALDGPGRDQFWRWARMAAGRAGRLHVQVLRRSARGAPGSTPGSTPNPMLGSAVGHSRPVDVAALEREVAAHRGRVVAREDLAEPAGPDGTGERRVSRLVVAWDGVSNR